MSGVLGIGKDVLELDLSYRNLLAVEHPAGCYDDATMVRWLNTKPDISRYTLARDVRGCWSLGLNGNSG